MISIHAPRTGSDLEDVRAGHERGRISIHAPRTGSDAARNLRASPGPDFNPRSPHGERRPSSSLPRAAARFQSTLPARGATSMKWRGITMSNISIHAPRTGSDTAAECCSCRWRYFNPRSPHGERPARIASRGRYPDFNPRSPHGERQLRSGCRRRRINFNPRSPHGERRAKASWIWRGTNFNPRSPHGERRSVPDSSATAARFQSTLPARGATFLLLASAQASTFQSTLPARGAT